MGETSDFYRMYLVPGMLHCGGGVGPSTVDWVAALDSWVTAGKAPGDLLRHPGRLLERGAVRHVDDHLHLALVVKGQHLDAHDLQQGQRHHRQQ